MGEWAVRIYEVVIVDPSHIMRIVVYLGFLGGRVLLERRKGVGIHYTEHLKTLSKRLRRLPQLRLSTDWVPKFPPANGMHDASFLAPSKHNAVLISISRNVVVSAVTQTDHGAAHQVANAETLFNLDLVLFCCANIFAPDLRKKGFPAYGVVDDEDLARGEAWAQTRYAD